MDVLHSIGELDVLPYYIKVAPFLKDFLKGLELATKILLPNGAKLLKRGSKLEPLFINELIGTTDEDFMKLRKLHLDEARPNITKTQDKIWQYFFPRKLMNLFYATNRESEGKPISRIFFDIDRADMDATKSQRVASLLIEEINSSEIDFKSVFPMWTGNSFHVYVLLKREQPHSFYEKNIQCAEDSDTVVMRWVRDIATKCDFKIVGSHEKIKNAIIIDPSQTPSGKLARAPFSLYVKDPKKVRSVAIPLTVEMLEGSDLVQKLKSYTPDSVISELKQLGKRIPNA